MKTARKKIFTFALCMIMSFSVALAGQKTKDKDKDKGKGTGVNTRVAVDIFMVNDRDLIRNHYKTNRGNLPPGLAKRGGDLPPGLEKQLVRNGHLPPGLEKKLYPFPVELERTLPPLKPDLIRGVIGGSAVIMNSKTRVILDIFALL
jgi:hypothetical protein